ncbi:MAG: hypothetical protein IH949_06550 [Bacteroidetes bacterium]|nr:hypothetical protein [Bacteroidota bacterium]
MTTMHKVSLILLCVFIYHTGATQDVPDCKSRKNQTLNVSGYQGEGRASNSRSDSIDILHTTISLDITDIPGRIIGGWTELEVKALKNNITTIGLDLLKLTVDSIWVNNNPSTFQYNDTLITVDLPSTINSGDEVTIRVFYQGDPEQDAQWGGFYFTGNYAFNLGVGFAADPHNFGRVWFPCFDNFVERSTYSFYIKTLTTDKAFCNGLLIDTTHEDTTITWHYELLQTIPSYLVAVAVSNYQTVSFTYDGIPIRYAAVASDTANMKLSFINIGGAIDAFQKAYGPHSFDIVGFNVVPFAAGAMEHPTAIAYPRNAVTGGTTANEYLMAHEFAHHWWGDMITCRTQEDMWLNEGWASYSEYLFFEEVYGRERYNDEVRSNHEKVLRKAHIDDNGFIAVQ